MESNLSSASSESEEDTNKCTDYDFWDHHKQLTHGHGHKRPKKISNDKLTMHLSNPVSSLNSNPLEQWEYIKTIFPSLYMLARMHLVRMATSVPY